MNTHTDIPDSPLCPGMPGVPDSPRVPLQPSAPGFPRGPDGPGWPWWEVRNKDLTSIFCFTFSEPYWVNPKPRKGIYGIWTILLDGRLVYSHWLGLINVHWTLVSFIIFLLLPFCKTLLYVVANESLKHNTVDINKIILTGTPSAPLNPGTPPIP